MGWETLGNVCIAGRGDVCSTRRRSNRAWLRGDGAGSPRRQYKRFQCGRGDGPLKRASRRGIPQGMFRIDRRARGSPDKVPRSQGARREREGVGPRLTPSLLFTLAPPLCGWPLGGRTQSSSSCTRKRSFRRSIRRAWILHTRDSERSVSCPISRIGSPSQYLR